MDRLSSVISALQELAKTQFGKQLVFKITNARETNMAHCITAIGSAHLIIILDATVKNGVMQLIEPVVASDTPPQYSDEVIVVNNEFEATDQGTLKRLLIVVCPLTPEECASAFALLLPSLRKHTLTS